MTLSHSVVHRFSYELQGLVTYDENRFIMLALFHYLQAKFNVVITNGTTISDQGILLTFPYSWFRKTIPGIAHLEFNFYASGNTNYRGDMQTLTLLIEQYGENNTNLIQPLLIESCRWFKEDHQRYHYFYESFGVFLRTPFTTCKRWDQLFWKDKTRLQNRLTHFMEKTGPYGRNRVVHRLGLLLHGPPGSGKTTLIKCVAQELKRHIMTIPLRLFTSDEQLVDFFLQKTIKIKNDSSSGTVNFHISDILFVVEDVDCLSNVVQRQTNDQNITTGITLSGLLNVLDGVVEMPGRVIIMTTNHPDRLDEALIRPGRMDMTLFLGDLDESLVEQMIVDWFPDQTFPPECQSLLHPIGAAKLENWCMEETTIEGVIDRFTK